MSSDCYYSFQNDALVGQLVSLLLPIDALLSHMDCTRDQQVSSELVVLFRNMWFLCTLFLIAEPDDKEGSATEWRRPALARIATHTPALISEGVRDALISEGARDTLVSDVEYNPVIGLEYAHIVCVAICSSTNVLIIIPGYFETSCHPLQDAPTSLQSDTDFATGPRYFPPHNA